VFVAMLFVVDLGLESSSTEYLLADRSLAERVGMGVTACALITLLGANQSNAFIYFRF